MKNLFTLAAFSLLFGACSNSQKPVSTDRTKAVLDSVNASNAINTANLERQKSIDSMKMTESEKEASHRQHIAYVNHSVNHITPTEVSATNEASPTTGTSVTPTKKGMSNKTKGALIGAGTGAVLGAVTGVVVDGKKGEGAVVGGLIGAATGAGAGAVIGNHKDKKASSTSTTQP